MRSAVSATSRVMLAVAVTMRLRDGFLDAVGAGLEVGHRLHQRGVDRGVERSEALGGDVGPRGDRLGQGAQTLIDHVGDRLARRIDAGLDDVGGLAGAFAHGGGGAVDAGGHAALGIGDAHDGAVDAAAEIVVDLADLAGDERANGGGAVDHDVGDRAQARHRSCRVRRCPGHRWCGQVPWCGRRWRRRWPRYACRGLRESCSVRVLSASDSSEDRVPTVEASSWVRWSRAEVSRFVWSSSVAASVLVRVCSVSSTEDRRVSEPCRSAARAG